MGLYDTGPESSVEFTEKVFDRARDYKEQQAEKEDDFSRNLLLANTVVTGANAILDSRADALDRAQVPQQTAYQATLENSAYWRGIFNGIKAEGQTNSSYLLDKAYTQALQSMTREYPAVAQNDPNFNKLVMAEARKLRDEQLESFNNLETAVFNVPTFENFPEFYRSHNTLPRNLGSWMSGGISSIFRRHSDESIALEGQQVSDAEQRKRDALFGTEIGQQLTDIKNTIEIFDNNGILTSDLSDQIQQGIDEGRIFGERGNITQQEFSEQLSDGSVKNTVLMVQLITDPNTGLQTLKEVEGSKVEQIIHPDDPVVSIIDLLTFTQDRLTPEGRDRYHQITKDLQGTEGMYFNQQLTHKGFYDVISQLESSDYAIDITSEVQIFDLSTELGIKQYQRGLEIEFSENAKEGLVTQDTTGQVIVNPGNETAVAQLRAKGIHPDLLIYNNIVRFGGGTKLLEGFNISASGEDSEPYGESLSSLLFSDSYAAFLTDEQKNSIGTTLSEMSDDSSKIPKVIRDLITYSRTSNPDKDFYFLNEESPFSLGQFTEQLTGVSLDRDSPDSNIILVWDQPNTRLSYITKEEASIPTRQTGDEGRGIGGDIEINEDNLALESRRREGRGRQRTLEWQAPPIDILEKAVQDVDLSSLTAGQLQTLSLMSDEKIAENLGLGENIRLRSPAMDASTRLPIISFNLLFRTKSQNRLNELGINLGSTRADPISQEFFDSFKALLIEGSKSYLEEE